ncbi:DMT family transporter [Sneathiella aquimaris]|uniref:DMT family transporter n=1 Tax=Sneathiella aquimaris TaxID=2599305 RepID=UPI00146A4DD1|nr:EamA family transporter [Sneathiella aquimaris]
MNKNSTLLITALAPMIWGSSYIVSTQFLINLSPLTISFFRAVPAGLLLLLLVRELPKGIWIPRMFLLGALNFSIFWSLLFFAAHRLPGGVAAILGALQPFIVIFAARYFLGSPIRIWSLVAVLAGFIGVALLILTPDATLNFSGVIAGILGSVSMALGTVLSRKWHPPVSSLTFTAWQLTAGGLLLLPFLLLNPSELTEITTRNIWGLAYLGLIGGAITYVIWLRGVKLIHPSAVSILGFLSPTTATLLGWLLLEEALSGIQIVGILTILSSVFWGQYTLREKSPA